MQTLLQHRMVLLVGAVVAVGAAVGLACVFIPPLALLSSLVVLGIGILVLARASSAAALLMVAATVQYVFFFVTLSWFDVMSPVPMGRLADLPTREVQIFFPLALVLCLWHLGGLTMSRTTPRPMLGGLAYPLVLLLGYAALGLLWSPNLNWTIVSVFFLLSNMLVFALLVSVIRDVASLRAMLWLYATAGVVHAVMIIGSFFVPQPGSEIWSIPVIGDSLEFAARLRGGVFDDSGDLRRTEVMAEYHHTGLILTTQLGAIGALLSVTKGLRRILLILAFILVLYTALWTTARGTFLGVLSLMAAGVCLVPPFRRRAWLLGPVLLATALALVLLQSQVQGWIMGTEGGSRLLGAGAAGKESEFVGSAIPASRMLVWREVLPLMSVKGIGAQNFTLYTAPQLGIYSCHPHSVYNAFLLDYGAIGLAFLIFLGWVLWRRYKAVRCHSDSEAKTLALALFAGLVGVGVECLVDFDYNVPFIWTYSGLAYAALSIAGATPPEEASEPSRSVQSTSPS